MPEATGDIREIIGQARGQPLRPHTRPAGADALCPRQPVFLPLYNLFLVYGSVFRLSFGPKSFVVVSDPAVAKSILLTNAKSYSKGLLAEILEFVMGTGLIPADGEIWRIRRRAILPSLHRRYVEAMVGMFGSCALHGCKKLALASAEGRSVEMENFFSRLSLDIIGKAVFNYEFDSLTHDDPVISAVYTVLREAEHRSIAIFPYWNFPGAAVLVPRQRAAAEALLVIETTLNKLIAECKVMVEAADEQFVDEYLNRGDPSILRFLIASGDKVSSKQLRDDLMTLLIAGHETTAAVLTWTFYLLARHPEAARTLRDEVDAVLGDRAPTGSEDLKALRFTTRVINEVRPPRRAAPFCTARRMRTCAGSSRRVPAAWLA
jgi:beta-ring hydroxylase